MKTEHICPSCKKPLPESAPQGLCPECLMKAGFGSSAGQPGGNPKFVPPSVADVARLFPQLEVLELIGQGGMGAVYKARQPGLDRLVALKVLPPEATATPGFAERFTREARALARLNHPNIVSVYDFGQAGALHYFLMEYVDGVNLRQLVQSGRLSAREALQIVPQICDALQFAHDEGIVHRDIKPENVLVDKRGRVKVADFGLAKLLGAAPETLQLTGARDVMGTPHYMAPEQVEKPGSVDHRADIYSLGVVFYELLTGELPIGKFAPPSKKVSVDVRLDEIVLHTLEKEPDRRYQHVSEVKSDVETVTHTCVAPSAAPAAQPAPDKSPEALQWQEALRQVKGPAIGLLATALLNWVAIPLVVLIGTLATAHRGPGAPFYMVGLPLAALALSSVLLVAALKMQRLQAYWLAVIASVLAMIVTPGNLIGLPVGIWSLVVLTQARVRNCFGKEPLPSWLPAAPAPGSNAWKVAAVIVAAALLLCALPAGLMVAALGLPALHRARAVSRHLSEYTPATGASLAGLRQGGGEALDLDSRGARRIPTELSQPDREADLVKWLADEGLDLVFKCEDGRWILGTTVSNELKLTPVPNNVWKYKLPAPLPPVEPAAVPEVVRENSLWVTYRLAPEARPPLTFEFETGSGRTGLVQLLSLTENPAWATLHFQLRKQ